MARIDFPSNPSDGQTLTVTVAGSNTVYTYNATYGVWRSLASSDAYLQVANLQPALDKYLQVSNGTSLTSFDVITNTPSGNGSLVYSSSNGSFTFTPANATQGGGGVTQDTLDQYLQVANSTSFATTSSLDAYLQVANSTGFASSTDLDAYLQVANSTGFASSTDLDAYLQVANSTSFATTSSLDAYLQVANSTSFASTSQLDAYLQVANSTSFASTSDLDTYLQVANSTSFATTSQLDGYLQVANGVSLTAFDVLTSTPSGNGSLVYNSSNGSFTFTPANATQGGVGGGGSGNTNLTVSDSAPDSPADGDLWFDSGDLILFVYYDDGSSSQWVETIPSSSPDLSGYLQVANAITLTSFDVLTSTPSGNGSLVYNSSNGSFTFTPADATQGGGGGGVTQDTLDNYLQVANGVSLAAFDVLTSTPSGNGSLSYSSSNGSFTFTPANLTENSPSIVYALSGTDINPTNGGTQTKTLSADTTFTESLGNGDSVVLMLNAGASYTVTWPTITWVTSNGNAAPTLTANDTLVFWKVDSTLYGAYVGSYA